MTQPSSPAIIIPAQHVNVRVAPGPAGEDVVVLALVNPLAQASIILGPDDTEQVIKNLSHALAEARGIVVPDNAGKIIVPGS